MVAQPTRTLIGGAEMPVLGLGGALIKAADLFVTQRARRRIPCGCRPTPSGSGW